MTSGREAPAPERRLLDHPGISFHGVYPHDHHDDHGYDSRRHRTDKLSGTSRLSRARIVFGLPRPVPGGAVSGSGKPPASDREGGVEAALAAADRGDLAAGVRSMRRAILEADAGVACAAIRAEDRARFLRHAGSYLASARRGGGIDAHDAAFMHAALHFVLANYGAAERWIERAIEAGDQSRSAGLLRREVRRRLYRAL